MSRRAIWTVTITALAAAFAVTFPLVLHLREAIPYGAGIGPERRFQDLVPGDPLQFYYYLSLVPRMIAGELPWFRDSLQFAAPEPNPRLSFFFLPFSLVFALISPLGNTVAYNALVFASFPAIALATFALARRLGLETAGAAFAAAALTLLPYRVATLAHGHPAGFVLFLVPGIFAALERAWWRESPRAAAVAAAFALFLAWNEPHFLYFLGFLLPMWLLMAAFRLGEWRERPPLVPALPRLAIAGLGPAFAYGAYVARRETTLSSVDALLIWLVMSATLAVVWRVTVEARARAGETAGDSEATSFLPLLGLGLYPLQWWLDIPYGGRILAVACGSALVVAKRPLLVAIARLARGPAGRDFAQRLVALWPFAVGLLVAGGFALHFKASVLEGSTSAVGRKVREVRLFSSRPEDFFARSSGHLTHQLYPGVVVVGLAAASLTRPAGRWLVAVAVLFAILALGLHAPVWLPYFPAAFAGVPFFAFIRQTSKFFFVAALLLALAGGLGLDRLVREVGGRRGLAAAVLALALLAFDFSSLPLGLSRLPTENRAYAIVGAEGRGTNLLEIPIWPGDSAYSSIYQFWTTRTGVPIVNGYSPTHGRDYAERVFRVLEPLNVGDLTEAIARRLDELRVQFVTFHADVFASQVSIFGYRRSLEALRRDPNLIERAADGGAFLFERREGAFQPHEIRIGWPIRTFFEAESLRVAPDTTLAEEGASGGTIQHGTRARGPNTFGPFRSFPPGAYTVRFRVRGDGLVEATTNGGRMQLAERKVSSATWETVDVAFSLDQTRPIEFRTWNDAGKSLDADWVLAESSDAGADADRIEAERLPVVAGFDREAAEASGGAYAVVGAPPGAVARDGPYRWTPAGRLGLAVRSRGAPLLVRVESADGRQRFGELSVEGRPSWGLTTASIEVPVDAVLCARIVAIAPESADVDYVEWTKGS